MTNGMTYYKGQNPTAYNLGQQSGAGAVLQ